ncbi:MAG: glycosyltransferase, partial [Oscillospiraceae bacterium]|nr:glycosyltransferase [Oscillospiraceae bacterium]
MARNSGMDVATGDYLYFMDPDDTIDCTLFEQVIESLKNNPAQIVLFGMVEEYFSKTGELKKTFCLCHSAKVFRDREELRKEIIYLEKDTMYGYPWNKFFDFQYIKEKNLRFKAVTLIEDIMFNVECFMQAETLNILGTTPYHYKKRNTASLTSRFVADYFDLHKQRLQMIKDQYVAWGLYTNKVRNILGNIYCRYIFSALQRNCDPRSDMRHKDRKQ